VDALEPTLPAKQQSEAAANPRLRAAVSLVIGVLALAPWRGRFPGQQPA